LSGKTGAAVEQAFTGRPSSGVLMRLAPRYRVSSLIPACVAAGFFVFCLAVQGFSGSWYTSFLAYPDEPSHFVGAVMVRDWLVSGRWFAPLQFARNYYEHYPFFAIGYWPPLFSLVTGIWMLVAGVGKLQALVIPAAMAAGTGWLVFRLTRRRTGLAAGVCAGALYLNLPMVRHWMCAVMVDGMTAFLCVAAAACLIRYLERPILWNGILYAVCCGCAILSKYSAAYTLALPFLAVLLLRRFELIRKPAFFVQPVIVALIAGPWALWTRGLANYGLPAERDPLTVMRAAAFAVETFKIFPPALMAVVILGLIALLFRPGAWREDLVVLSLLCAGHLAFLFFAPVGAEQRYLLAPAAALLVLSFAGWPEVASMLTARRRATTLSISAVLLTAMFMASQFSHFERMPPDRIGDVVAFIVRDPARAAQRVVVPPAFEGPFIAGFVSQSLHRPDHTLLRPSKILSNSNWFGLDYSSTYHTPEEVLRRFGREQVNLLIWDERPETRFREHEHLMSEMLRQYPMWWHKMLSLGSAGGSAPSWSVYEYRAPAQR
jgi:hypothetical protein